MARQLLKFANGLLSAAVLLALATAGLYAGYALWDNGRIYAAAEGVQQDMLRFKPHAEEPEEVEPVVEADPAFADLLAINADVRGWVTIDNTHIDHPILQGDTNFSYINTDVYGNFALAGSIFLDAICDGTFRSNYQLLYGHNMASGDMFANVNLFKDEAFFGENRTGTLMVPNRTYALRIFACLVVRSSDEAIFAPEKWQVEIDGLLQYAREHAKHIDVEALDAMLEAERESGEAPSILALSTCSSEFTNARTVVLAEMQEVP